MSRTIWKYEFRHDYYAGDSTFEMPIGAIPIAVEWREENENLCLWAEVEPSNATQQRTFCAVPTGGRIDSGYHYIGMIQEHEHVWHIFEKRDWISPDGE